MTSPVKRRPTGRHHGDLRNALERAALELVAEKGPHGFSLNEASRRAGVSVAAPYKHFADREALLASLAAAGYREQRARFAAAVEAATDPADPADALAAFAAAYVRFAAEQPALFDVTFYAGLDKDRHPELAAAGDAVLATVLPAARAVAADERAAFDLLLRVAAAAHGLAVFLRQGLFGVSGDILDETADRAARTARAIVADLRR